jgi:hypothetical protein
VTDGRGIHPGLRTSRLSSSGVSLAIREASAERCQGRRRNSRSTTQKSRSLRKQILISGAENWICSGTYVRMLQEPGSRSSRHAILTPGDGMADAKSRLPGSVLRVTKSGGGRRDYSVAAWEPLGPVASDQRKKRRSHTSQRNGRTNTTARITLSTIPLRLDWWIRALSQFGQQIILLLLILQLY